MALLCCRRAKRWSHTHFNHFLLHKRILHGYTCKRIRLTISLYSIHVCTCMYACEYTQQTPQLYCSSPPTPCAPLQTVSVTELYMPSHKLLPLFAPLGHHKQSTLEAKTVREAVTAYVKTNELTSPESPRYKNTLQLYLCTCTCACEFHNI